MSLSRGLLAFALSLLVSFVAVGQTVTSTVTNADVIDMRKAGIGDQTIILAIQRGPCRFDVSPHALIALKAAGISDKLLDAILAVSGVDGVQKPEQPSVTTNDLGAFKISDPSEALAFDRARSQVDPRSRCGYLETFLELYPNSVAKDFAFRMLSESYVQVADTYTNTDPMDLRTAAWLYARGWNLAGPSEKAEIEKKLDSSYLQYHGSLEGLDILKSQAASSKTQPPPVPVQETSSVVQRPQSSTEGLTFRVVQEQSIPYTNESRGGFSTTCNIVGTANTSASAYQSGNITNGTATTSSNQRMSCNSYDTTVRWPHVLNVMFVEASNGNSYIIGCDRAWRWSKCVPLRAGDTFAFRFTERGIQVDALSAKGKQESPTYQVLQSRSLR